MRAISLARPMLIARNVFSSSFTISAAWVELTGTVVSKIESKTLQARSRTERRLSTHHLWHVVDLELLVAPDRCARARTRARIRVPTFMPASPRASALTNSGRGSCPGRSSSRGPSSSPSGAGGRGSRSTARSHERDVGIASSLGQRRRHADVHHLYISCELRRSRSVASTAFPRPAIASMCLEIGGLDVADVRLAAR